MKLYIIVKIAYYFLLLQGRASVAYIACTQILCMLCIFLCILAMLLFTLSLVLVHSTAFKLNSCFKSWRNGYYFNFSQLCST